MLLAIDAHIHFLVLRFVVCKQLVEMRAVLMLQVRSLFQGLLYAPPGLVRLLHLVVVHHPGAHASLPMVLALLFRNEVGTKWRSCCHQPFRSEDPRVVTQTGRHAE